MRAIVMLCLFVLAAGVLMLLADVFNSTTDSETDE